jgi:protein-disulfide isomerase
VAAYAAGKQHLVGDYAELFYREQGSEEDPYVTESYLRGLADQIPSLDFSQWLTERKDKALSSQVTADEKAASADGLDGTPTLVAIGKKAEIVPTATGIPTYSEIMSAVKAVSS